MAFRNDAWAKVWQVTRYDNYTEARISTSRKKKDSDEYEQDFGGFVKMIGKAHEKTYQLGAEDRIKLKEVAVTNSYKKETKQTFTNFLVFDFVFSEEEMQTAPADQNNSAVQETNNSNEAANNAEVDYSQMYNGF